MTSTFQLSWNDVCADCGNTIPAGSYAQYVSYTGTAMRHINGCPPPKPPGCTCSGDRHYRHSNCPANKTEET